MPDNAPEKRVTFVALSPDPEKLELLGTIVLTAAAVGDEVRVLLAGGALKAWVGSPRYTGGDTRLGLPGLADALQQARSLGAKVVVCETLARLVGVEPSGLTGLVDELVPLASFWLGTRGGRVVVL